MSIAFVCVLQKAEIVRGPLEQRSCVGKMEELNPKKILCVLWIDEGLLHRNFGGY
jgi:hypothetical protein